VLDSDSNIGQRQSLNVPGEMMNRAVGGENERAARGKGESDETRTSNGQRCLGGGGDLDNAAFALE
jgi:hypothetical protein